MLFFQAGRWVKQTVQIAAIILVVNAVSAVILSVWAGHLGIAGANSISQAVQTILLVLYLHRLLKRDLAELIPIMPLLKTMWISLLLLGGLWLFKLLLIPPEMVLWMRIGLTAGFGVVFYGCCAFIFRSEELGTLTAVIKGKKGQ